MRSGWRSPASAWLREKLHRPHLHKLAAPQDALHIPCQLHKQPFDEGVRDIHLRHTKPCLHQQYVLLGTKPMGGQAV